jgi:hypothetical protein
MWKVKAVIRKVVVCLFRARPAIPPPPKDLLDKLISSHLRGKTDKEGNDSSINFCYKGYLDVVQPRPSTIV